MRVNNALRLSLATAALLSAGACGLKGGLYLPARDEGPPAAEAPAESPADVARDPREDQSGEE